MFSVAICGGSPPPMRGKGMQTALEKWQTRITPAYAGKSFSCCFHHVKQAGSPPPMRGKVSRRSASSFSLRITPAYAGKSPVHQAHCKQGQDHPRLCGEKILPMFDLVSHTGSPPPMRGKVHKMNHSDLCSRITPAYAGKSFSGSGTAVS